MGRTNEGGEALSLLIYPGTKSGTLAQAAEQKKTVHVCVSISSLDPRPAKEGRPEKKREIFPPPLLAPNSSIL